MAATLEQRRARYEEILEMRRDHRTLVEIGERFGMSKQRVAAILRGGEPQPLGRPRGRAEAE